MTQYTAPSIVFSLLACPLGLWSLVPDATGIYYIILDPILDLLDPYQ